jgi:sec-independent protein translocase protein TatA
MSIGFWQIVIVVAVVVLLFGRGRISDLMGDVAKGIKSFKRGMAEDDAPEPRAIDHRPEETMGGNRTETKTQVG